MAKKRFYNADQNGYEMRKNTEMSDSRMISEDRNAIANLPQDVMIKAYPAAPYGGYPSLDDTARGIDRQMADDSGKRKTGSDPEMY